jgi:hypothetical protein
MHDPRCIPDITALGPLDIANYHAGYHVDAPTGVSATTSSGGNVTLTWDGSDLHNEGAFYFKRQDACGGPWSPPISYVGKNESIAFLTNQPGGLQNYQVIGTSLADSAAFSSVLTVNVPGTLTPPSTFTSSFSSRNRNVIAWSAVSSAYYKVVTDFAASGAFAPSCQTVDTNKIDADVSALVPNFAYYFRVQACDNSGACSAVSSNFVQTQRVTDLGWNYNFTFFRSGTDIIFQYVNLLLYGQSLALHARDGVTSTPVFYIPGALDPTPCIANGAISSPLRYYGSQFTQGAFGTVGHAVAAPNGALPVQCADGEPGQDAPNNHAGLLPP